MTLTDEVFGLSREERQGGGGISSGAVVIIDRLPLADCHNPILNKLSKILTKFFRYFRNHFTVSLSKCLL